MTEIVSQNLDAHYTNNSKVERASVKVVQPPNSVPEYKIFNDISANKRMYEINNDIYEKTSDAKGSSKKNFAIGFSTIVLSIIAFLGIRKFFK